MSKTTNQISDRFTKAFVLGLNLQVAKRELERKFPDLEGKLGITKKGVYRHNPKTGFNELVNKKTGKFTGRSPY
jgi:hypothetical protein